MEYTYLSVATRQFVSRDSARTLLQAIYEHRRHLDAIYQRLLPFVFGDLGVSPVTSIERLSQPESMVYDFCGCDNECFLGGEMPIMLHNTNRPDLLDPALRRPGRLDKKIPILPPNAEERVAILSVLTQVAFPGEEQAWPDAKTYASLAAQMEHYTGAEIEGIVGKAAQLRAADSSSIAQALQEAFERILPTTQMIEEMTRLALLSCNDLDLVPSEYRAWARELRKPHNSTPEEDQEELAPRRRAGRRDW